ncbi:DUF938 domain-containing protein [Oceanibacterium hippocampi]|uniref:SAM-dependent methyltransferase n=1 Tax=Oceanibacterium hippocampi TaxID=745714 RepID=A0A1Y5SYN8_9PROT|nr:DUF938 domain-containing protein [Oceanibacterium hippocampi]SLN49556.1 hypothetical protein OCH7691_02168 [Oceanibacterium hippocampi]
MSGANETDRRHAPATLRNREAILEVLARTLPANGTVLEIGSGSGEHAVYFAPRLPGLVWQPSNPDPALNASVAAWIAEQPADNLRPPILLDAAAPQWPAETAGLAAVFAANVIHIAPWRVCEGIMAGAGRQLREGGLVVLYGPYRRDGRHTAESNARFDASLRAQDAEWGVRDLADVTAAARAAGLVPEADIAMPANNSIVVFRKAS